MRTICWASRVAALLGVVVFATAAAVAQQRLVIAPGRSLRCASRSEHCVLRDKGRLRVVTLARDAAVLPHDTATLKLVAALPAAAIVIDSYSSAPGGAMECQAGTESFLRVLSFARTAPAVTYSVKLESCVQNVELALDGVKWDASTHQLGIQWLAAAAGQKSPDVTLTLDGAGHVR
jgi:hypothetical protein